MAQRIRPSHQLRALEARQAELRKELTELSASKRALLLRNALLSSWETLSYLQLMGGRQQPEDSAYKASGGRSEQLLAKEQQLLQQLDCKDGPLVTQASLEQLLQPDSSTIAPCTDPVAYLKDWACQTLSNETLSMDGPTLASLYRSIAQSASMWLHKLSTAAPCERTESAKQMTELWLRYWRALNDLIVAGKADVVEAAVTTTMDTMQADPAAAARHQAAQAAVAVPLLQLTPQQQELMPVGVKLFYDLLDVVYQERQEINSQMTAVVEAERYAKAAATATADACAAAGPAASSTDGNDLADRRVRLQQQEALTNRLTLLLHKEYKLRLTGMGSFVGSMSCEQLSRVAVALWSYGMRVLFVADEILQQSRVMSGTRTMSVIDATDSPKDAHAPSCPSSSG